MTCCAKSSSCDNAITSLRRTPADRLIGGLTLRWRLGHVLGQAPLDTEIADCNAAPRIVSRSVELSTTEVSPWLLVALMVLMPSMVELLDERRCDRLRAWYRAKRPTPADIDGGKSVRGSAATGSRRGANRPPTISAIDINRVATADGCRIPRRSSHGCQGSQSSTFTRAPGETRCWPSTTTRSPGCRPAVTALLSASLPVTVTLRISALLSGVTTNTNKPSWPT